MATALRKREASRPSAHRRSGPMGQAKPKLGQYYSLSPAARLRTLPLPFDIIADNVITDEVTADNVITKDRSNHLADVCPAEILHGDSTTLAMPSLALLDAHEAPHALKTQASQAQQALIAQLSREVKRIEVAGRVQPDQLGRRSAVFSTGSTTIDGCLPYGGYESGTIIEYLQHSAGSGATTLALSAAREALTATDRFCVIVDWRQQFYPPAAAALGLDLKRIVIVRPTTLADRLWAIDQALRSPAIVAVIAEIEQLDDRAARRLQLAAESGGSLGLLIRHSQRHYPSWAEVQWLVRPLRSQAHPASSTATAPIRHRPLQLELLRVRGGQSGSRVNIHVNSINGRIEPATAAAAALARTLARTDQTGATKARRA